ncbi:glycine-rich protein HC1-like [Olea europaea var. sylvestris]|uniref:glycine-rich protein HC1-like n=1 Tax=Olea europaea var. sylvestris TaxID=158386 RepID=UPI000C1D34B9|nr:glycine-rich protein HC1-like [Olea europaea var. sylvestris]
MIFELLLFTLILAEHIFSHILALMAFLNANRVFLMAVFMAILLIISPKMANASISDANPEIPRGRRLLESGYSTTGHGGYNSDKGYTTNGRGGYNRRLLENGYSTTGRGVYNSESGYSTNGRGGYNSEGGYTATGRGGYN